MQLKIATPGTVLNFADFLQRHRFFEESFRVYERAVLLFDWPRVYEIWLIYISKMVEKHAGSKLERIRHLFEQVLKGCPVEQSKLFLYMYADFEENFGLLSHAMEIYERAVAIMNQGPE
jgi:pre-mRNA-splicing factor SYF1